MQILIFVHKFYYHKETLPEIPVFANYFASNNIIHSYKTRNENMLHIFSVASSYVLWSTGCPGQPVDHDEATPV